MSVVCMCIRFTQFRSSLEADCCGQVMKSEHLFTGWLTFEFLRVLFCGIRNPYYIKKSRGEIWEIPLLVAVSTGDPSLKDCYIP